MSASQNNLTFVLNQQDSNGVNILNRTIGAVAYAGLVGQFRSGLLATTGATTIEVPTTNIGQFFFKNTHATANITLRWTPTAATGSVIATTLTPGSVLALWQAVSGSSGAITAMTGTSDVASGTYEIFLGG